MLDAFRKRSRSVVTNLILLVVAAVMTLWGVGQMNDQNSQGGAVAYVNGEPIAQRDFAQEYEYRLTQYTQMLGGQMDERFLKALDIPKRTLDEMVQYRLLAQQAKRLGVEVPDAELADFIRGLPYFQKNGQFDPSLYAKVPNRGMEESKQRERLRVARFQGYLSDRIRLTPIASRRSFQLKETKLELEFARINFDSLAKKQAPTPSEIDEYLRKTPEEQLQNDYNARQAEFAEPAKVELKQIRTGIPFQASDARKDEAKKKIEEINKGLTAENFSEKAKASSDDEYAKKGGLVGWINRGTLEAPLEAALDKLEVGKVSAPVETTFGYYLLLVTEKKDRTVKPLAEVKKQLAETVVKERKTKSFIEKTKAAWEAKLNEGKSIEPELKAQKIEIKKTGSFAAGSGFIPQLGQADEILDAVFQLTKNAPVAKKLFPVQQDFVYVKLLSLTQPKAEDFAKTQTAVETSGAAALQNEFFSQWMEGLRKSANVKIELKGAPPETEGT